MTEGRPQQKALEDNTMTLLDHLRELRTRLIWIVGAVVIGTSLSMLFIDPLLRFVLAPLTATGATAMAIGPTDTITIFFKVSLTAGAIVAMPVIVYQIIAFVTPGLYAHEKRVLLLLLPGIMFLFAVGAAFSYYLLLPTAVTFLQSFLGDLISQEWTIDRYVGFATRLVFWIGVAFEAPLIVAFLARMGIVSGPQLLGYWRHAIVVIAIAAAAITPTVDPVNMTLVMAPLILLYFGSVGIAYLLYRPRKPRDFSSEDFIPPEYRE
ncbi:MAG: twin-arginine translocase subunit TatC [Caldilineaceae bacterium]|nr:twin-arginine translocase subunit TatC [Caldilineaceae bacterium]